MRGLGGSSTGSLERTKSIRRLHHPTSAESIDRSARPFIARIHRIAYREPSRDVSSRQAGDFQIETVAVIGAGTMGAGIAQVCAMAGYITYLRDTSEALDRAFERIRETLSAGVARGKLTGEQRDTAIGNVIAARNVHEAVRDADLVIEAIPEDIKLKQELFSRIARKAPPNAVMASNTSSLSVTRIAEGTSSPERVIGLHFFNPAHLMRLVEVVRGEKTGDSTLSSALEFVRSLGKEPIVVSDSPGFASSRMGIVLGLEAMRMVEQGVATPQDIDRAMELGYNHPMGPLRLTDLVGLDIRLGIADYLHSTLGGDQYRAPDILRRMVGEGKLGKKSGQGFYDW
jgi:3-hydroxybutyryl-CoA dehydrogenase